MKLTDDEKKIKERGELAKSFLDSDFYNKYFYPYLEQETAKDFPAPNEEGWEEKYRLAWATAVVTKRIIQALRAWADQAKDLAKKQREPEKDWQEA